MVPTPHGSSNACKYLVPRRLRVGPEIQMCRQVPAQMQGPLFTSCLRLPCAAHRKIPGVSCKIQRRDCGLDELSGTNRLGESWSEFSSPGDELLFSSGAFSFSARTKNNDAGAAFEGVSGWYFTPGTMLSR